MGRVLVLLFSAISLHVTAGDVNVTDYIYWKKAEISAWHQFFPSRAFEEEQLTISTAISAVHNLSLGLNDSLSSIVTFQAQELETAQLLMQGTDAEGCVNGISHYMTNSIGDELETYLDCGADVTSKLMRINSTWAKTKNSYLASYIRAMNGINACAKTYPNKESIDRLKSCVESMNSNYFSAAGTVQSAMYPSPSMTYFQNTVTQCASTAATNVASKGRKFLGLLVECSKLSGTMDPVAYAEQLNSWPGFNDTLQDQISTSQSMNYGQVWSVEVEMVNYWNLQKEALEQYVIESRGPLFYLNNNYVALREYYNAVTAAALDNPMQTQCTNTAKAELDVIANDGAYASLACDVNIVNNTKELFSSVANKFLLLNTIMPRIGNAAILNCLSRGYIFAPNTIIDCFSLDYSGFDVDHSDRLDDIKADVAMLENYASSFYNGTVFPCGGSSKERLLLGGEKALYDLRRCLYISSGTTYAVTTPVPITSTTTWYPTPTTGYTTSTPTAPPQNSTDIPTTTVISAVL